MVGGEPSRRTYDNTPPGRHLLVIFSLCKVVRRRIGSIRRNVKGGRRQPRKERPKLYHPLVSSELRYFACLGQGRVADSPLCRSVARSSVATPRSYIQDCSAR